MHMDAASSVPPKQGTGLLSSFEPEIREVWDKALIRKREKGIAPE
jgi:hypothetical protein